MIIQIKVDIKYNHGIINYFKSYIVVKQITKGFGFATIFHLHLELVGPAHVRKDGSDHPSDIIEYAPKGQRPMLWS